MKKNNLCISIIILITFLAPSCKKLIDLEPPKNQLTEEKVFSNETSAIAATLNLYTLLASVDNNLVPSIGFYVDELNTSALDASSLEFSNSVLSSTNASVSTVWRSFYSIVYKANSLIEGLQSATALPDSTKNQCLAEAKFMRAYCYFYLVNLFGDVPLILTTSVNASSHASRESEDVLYSQIIVDLKEAKELLSSGYQSTQEKVRVNKWAVSALLARIYLVQKNWKEAEAAASFVIDSGNYSLDSLANVFLTNSKEAILQLWNQNGFSSLGSAFIPSSGAPLYFLTQDILQTFEPDDQRKESWLRAVTISGTEYWYPFKYKQRTAAAGNAIEYTVYLRLTEQLLIRAEARAYLNDVTGAAADLDMVRNRAGLPNTAATTQGELLSAILRERRVELFTEGGLRFIDLKRTETINTVMPALKPLWKPTAVLFPIPQAERIINPNLTQNPGYN